VGFCRTINNKDNENNISEPKHFDSSTKEFDLDLDASRRPSLSQDPQQQQPPPPPPYYPTGSLDSKDLSNGNGGMELTLTALHDPDEQLNMQQQQQHHSNHGQYQQPKAILGIYGSSGGGASSGGNGASGGPQHPHSNGYGYHVTSAIGVDSDSYQVLPSVANSAAGSHGHGNGHGHGHGLGAGECEYRQRKCSALIRNY